MICQSRNDVLFAECLLRKYGWLLILILSPVTSFSPRIVLDGFSVSFKLAMHPFEVSEVSPSTELALELRDRTIDLSGRKEYKKAFHCIERLFVLVDAVDWEADLDLLALTLSKATSDAVQSFVNNAFCMPHRGRRAKERIRCGLRAMDLTFRHKDVLPQPHGQVPRQLVLAGLRALVSVMSIDNSRTEKEDFGIRTAFRLLQRLVSGYGLLEGSPGFLNEKDFNLVLNAFVNLGRMELAHKVIALQERTVNAPPLSAVTYSIMLKGYGRLGDLRNVNMILSHASRNSVVPDIVMANSALDAFVNCNAFEAGEDLFFSLVSQTQWKSHHRSLFARKKNLRPNARTYNTYLKGLARSGSVAEALKLTTKMKRLDLWDAVTTNTLVSTAVRGQQFTLAEEVLSRHTCSFSNGRGRQHPNVEAYTELLDGYAKHGDIENALRVMQTMNSRNVPPNVFTYTSMIGALARAGRASEATRLLHFMSSVAPHRVDPSVVTINALLSGLVQSCQPPELSSCEVFDVHKAGPPCQIDSSVDEAMAIFSTMDKFGINPNERTLSILIEALGKCNPPRVEEALTLLTRFKTGSSLSEGRIRVKTAMIKAWGAAGQLENAKSLFSSIKNPDVVAINSYMDVLCRHGEMADAFGVFSQFFSSPEKVVGTSLSPDVISYSILVNSLLGRGSLDSFRKAHWMYRDMKSRGVQPDNTLIDM